MKYEIEMRHSQFLHEEIRVLRRDLTRHGMPERRGSLVVAEGEERRQRDRQEQYEKRSDMSHPSLFVSMQRSCIPQEHTERADEFPSTVQNVERARGQTPAHAGAQSAELGTKTHQQHWNFIDFNYMGVSRCVN